MLRKPGWTSTAFFAALGTFVAISATAAATSHAAADTCLTEPGSVTPKGQHWYYRLDHANNRKCWYLRAPTPTPPAQAAAPAAGDAAAPPTDAAAPTETPVAAPPPTKPEAVAAPPSAAAVPPPAAAAAPASVEPEMIAPPPGETDANAAEGPTNLAPATPAYAAAGPDAADADLKTGSVPAEASTDVPAAVQPGSIAEPDRTQPSAAAAGEPSTGAVAENLLIIGFAAALAGIVSAVFAAFRRRKAATARPIDAAPRFGSKFDSKVESRSERRSVRRTRVPARTAPASHSTPIEASLIPEQVTMARPSAPPRGPHRTMRDQRIHADAASRPD